MSGFSTRALHGPAPGRDVHGSLRLPVYDTVAFEHTSARDMELAFQGKSPSHVYSRITNPSVAEFEQRLAHLAAPGQAFGMALSSGMAAITTAILTLAESGTNIVTTKHLFGNTLSLFEKTLAPWGLETRYVSMLDLEAIEGAIDSQTRAVFLESITNPQLEVADIQAIGAITAHHGVPLVVDNTMMTPYLFQSRDAGVNIEILSSTKYISGGATSLGGVIIDNCNFDWKQSPKLGDIAKKFGPMTLMRTMRQEVFRNTGSCMAPHNSYLQTLGLETLAIRIDRSCDTALQLAQFLQDEDNIKSVHYPGLTSSPFHEISASLFNNHFGGILTFTLERQEDCFTFIDSLALIKRATNINDNKTLIIHPSSTIFAEYSEEEKEKMGLDPGMIRLSVGLEDPEDLIHDLKRGIEAL